MLINPLPWQGVELIKPMEVQSTDPLTRGPRNGFTCKRSLIMGQTGSIFSQIWRACNRLRSLRIKTSVAIWFVTTCAVFCRGHMLILALTSFSHWSIPIGPGSRRLTMIRLLGALSQATTAFCTNTSRRMPSLSLGKSGANICGSKVSQSTLMRDCNTGQHPLASACHRLTL